MGHDVSDGAAQHALHDVDDVAVFGWDWLEQHEHQHAESAGGDQVRQNLRRPVSHLDLAVARAIAVGVLQACHLLHAVQPCAVQADRARPASRSDVHWNEPRRRRQRCQTPRPVADLFLGNPYQARKRAGTGRWPATAPRVLATRAVVPVLPPFLRNSRGSSVAGRIIKSQMGGLDAYAPPPSQAGFMLLTIHISRSLKRATPRGRLFDSLHGRDTRSDSQLAYTALAGAPAATLGNRQNRLMVRLVIFCRPAPQQPPSGALLLAKANTAARRWPACSLAYAGARLIPDEK
jgi:hypothetical protein